MKKVILFLSILILSLHGLAQKSFTINGAIRGKADGMKVLLREESWPEMRILDSAVIKNGQFQLKGKVEYPGVHYLIIDRTPKGETSTEKNWLLTRFYLENSPITFSGNIDSLPTYFYSKKPTQPAVITGSATEDESKAFQASFKDLMVELSKLENQYLEVYHRPALEGKFNTKEGIELVKKQKVVQKKIDGLRWKYIMDHPNSVVAYDQATQYTNGFSLQLNAGQLDSLRATIAKGWTGTRKYTVFDSMVENAKKGAIGVKYMDFELTTQKGGKAMLSEYVSDKKYVLLEFWASWCGPCRGEIPHLKEVNGQKAENFEIISISLDESDEDWKKAIDEEGMNWVQLSAPQGFESPIAKAYNILGIPFSLLLDKDGKIIASGVRGAWLEEELEGLE